MRIVLNAVSFSPGRMGGVESYFRSLVRSLQQVDAENVYRLICHERHLESLPITNPGFAHLHCGYAKPSLPWYLRAALRDLTRIDILTPFVERLDADLVHHPFSVLNPAHRGIPSVLTFHDMQHEFYPEYFSRYALWARKSLWEPSARKATRIIAISGHAKGCLVERYGIDPDKIDVVYNCHDAQFRPLRDRAALDAVAARHRLDRPFIYYPAATWPHKNHKVLLAALKILKGRLRFDGRLVLSGIAMRENDAVLQEIRRLGLRDDVLVLGYLPNQELPALYNLARLMVFPSRFEGFGIPLVEAMACGCPIACADATSIPEVVGDCALTFSPDSAEEMAQRIWTLWTDEGVRQDLRSRGLERAALFTPENMARGTLQVYRKVPA